MSSSQSETDKPRRPRRVTDIALQWVAQRLRRSEEIKEEIKSGTYSVDPRKVAASLANEE